jgi:hypothetical protein
MHITRLSKGSTFGPGAKSTVRCGNDAPRASSVSVSRPVSMSLSELGTRTERGLAHSHSDGFYVGPI